MNVRLILIGFIIGIGKIIPGVSGSMLAMLFGIYEKLLYALTHFFNDLKNNLLFLLNFGVGVFIAILVFSRIILYLLAHYYNFVMFLFIGLILSTLINFSKSIKLNKSNIFLFIISLVIMSLLSMKLTTKEFIFNGTLINYLYVFLLGGIDAVTSIVPGISGTAIFILLGTYEFILGIMSNPFNLIFIVYSIGIFINIIITCFIMNYLIQNRKNIIYPIIFAFSIGSILLLIKNLIFEINILYIFVLIIGVFIGKLFSK